MPDLDVEARKWALRRAGRGTRPRNATCSQAVVARLLSVPELMSATRVALYSGIGDEVRLDAVFEALWERGVKTLAPRVLPAGHADGLELLEVRGAEGWASGYAGILEPRDGPCIAASEVDVFVVPGLLFDRRLRRLGRGRGHYDRLLAGAREDALRIGICYADRVVDELPTDSWDVPMHLIVTERELIQ